MFKLVVLAAFLAVAAAAPGLLATSYAAAPAIGATLLPRVQVGPTQVNVVRQPVTVQQPEYVYRSVPVPVAHPVGVKAVAYTAPAVATYSAAPAIAAYAAPAYASYAAPAYASYAAPAYASAVGTVAGPAVVQVA